MSLRSVLCNLLKCQEKQTISVINRSSLIIDDHVKRWIRGVQTQVSDHFAPIWGKDAELGFISSEESPPEGTWWMVVADDPDVAHALGYHDLTMKGLPLGKVFVKPSLKVGESVSVPLSHEVLEMLLDPDINKYAMDPSALRLYAWEACDAVQGDTYVIDGVEVSNFLYPDFFSRYDVPGRLDYLNLCDKSFETRPFGYQIVTEGSRIFQVYGAEGPRREAEPAFGSRRERRLRRQWRASEIQ